MTTLIVNIPNNNDLPFLQEVLDRFGLSYSVNNDGEYSFSKDEIDGFLKTNQEYLDGHTTARDWNDIKEDLNRVYNKTT